MRAPMPLIACSVLALSVLPHARAEDPPAAALQEHRSVTALKTAGAKQCGQALQAMTGVLNSDDDYPYLNTWNQEDPNRHAVMTISTTAYADGSSIAAVGMSPTTAGSCDASFAQVFLLRETCARLRETSFKDWKHYADLGTTPLHEDPTSSSVVAAFVSTQEVCLVFKAGLLFFPPVQR